MRLLYALLMPWQFQPWPSSRQTCWEKLKRMCMMLMRNDETRCRPGEGYTNITLSATKILTKWLLHCMWIAVLTFFFFLMTIVLAVISIVLYLTDKGEHTALCKIRRKRKKKDCSRLTSYWPPAVLLAIEEVINSASKFMEKKNTSSRFVGNWLPAIYL